MKKIKKSEFVSWQRYEFEHTFMFQGVLLLVSGAVSTLLYFLLVLLLSLLKDSVLTTVIYNGDLITTKLSPPIFWSAIVAAAAVAALFVFSDLLRIIFGRIIVHEEPDRNEITSKYIVSRVLRTVTLQYVFYVSVYVLWLYASAVFSFLIKNGMFLYPLIFVMLTFLTFFGKKIFSFPIYTLMKKQQSKEKIRRGDEYLMLKTDEGGSRGNIVTKRVTRERDARVFSTVEDALRTAHSSANSIRIVMGVGISLSQLSPKKFDVSIGVSTLSMLTEDELYAAVCHRVMRYKSRCLDSLNRFEAFNDSIAFSLSNWNPLERVYSPFNAYIASEMEDLPLLFDCSDNDFYPLFLNKYGEDVERNAAIAEIKQWMYKNHEFGFDREFYASLFKNKRPLSDYHKRLMRRYWAYVSQKGAAVTDRISEASDEAHQLFPYDTKTLRALAQKGKLDLTKRPKGAYNDEVKRFSKEFDTAFVLCVHGTYRRVRKATYLDPESRIRAFETDRINGVFKSDEDILSVANDYLTLKMPSAALSLISEISGERSAYAEYLEGVSRLSLGDKEGIKSVASACEALPDLSPYFMLSYLDRLTLLLPDKELEYARARIGASVTTYLAQRVRADSIWHMDDLKGEYRLTSHCSSSYLSDKIKEELSEDLQRICRDRFEWAAVLRYTEGGRSRELVVVRTATLTPGAYSDSFVDGVYLDGVDTLPTEVRRLDCHKKYSALGIEINVYPDAPVEAFERMKGAIFFHKGSIAAKRFLSREAKSYESNEETFDEIDTEESDDE